MENIKNEEKSLKQNILDTLSDTIEWATNEYPCLSAAHYMAAITDVSIKYLYSIYHRPTINDIEDFKKAVHQAVDIVCENIKELEEQE